MNFTFDVIISEKKERFFLCKEDGSVQQEQVGFIELMAEKTSFIKEMVGEEVV